MTTPTLFKEYIWLVNTIHDAGGITLKEINEKWTATEMSGGVELSRSTFRRHKDAIEEIFGIYIECDRDYRYSIGNGDALGRDSVQQWMLQTLTVSHIIGESLSLKDRILLETVPLSKGHLEMIVEAMKHGHRLLMTYGKYGEEPRQRMVEPYCIKLYQRRWYLLGRVEKGRMKVFAFDRIMSLEPTGESFTLDPDFHAGEYFAESYGVVRMEGVKAVRIVLRAYGDEGCYLRSLPLHGSQREVGSGEGYADFEYCLQPTLDLCGYILSRGKRLQVLAPAELATQGHQMLREAAAQYE